MYIRNAFNKFRRLVLVSLGLVCLVLGIVGYVLPGLPGTIWLIIAATLFIRSSDRLYRVVVQNRLFGRQVREFLETGAMPLRAKVMSLTSMWIFTLISLFLAPYGGFLTCLFSYWHSVVPITSFLGLPVRPPLLAKIRVERD